MTYLKGMETCLTITTLRIKIDKLKFRFKKIAILIMLLLTTNFLNAQKVTLNAQNKAVPDVLNEIKAQTNYSSMYLKSIGLDHAYVTIVVQNQKLSDVLETMFKSLPYTYKITNKTIVITPSIAQSKQPVKITSNSMLLSENFKSRLINGIISDSLGNPIPDVLVKQLSTGKYTYSNEDGSFSIDGDQSQPFLFVKYGFKDKNILCHSKNFNEITLTLESLLLPNVNLTSIITKKDPTRFVDVSNKLYMNLGQILQGTVPGLSLQIASSNQKTVNSIDIFQVRSPGSNEATNSYYTLTVDEFLQRNGSERGQQIINDLLRNPDAYSTTGFPRYRLNTSTAIKSTLVPQIRGVNSFGTGSNAMLVVIDGFPQDDFPADYPMNNVESIEVVKDPKELTKWGSRAAGGAILIKTKNGKRGSLNVNYTTNFYYQPAPKFDREEMQLASSADYLDYIQSFNTAFDPKSFNLSPANRIFSQKYYNVINQAQFDKSWDSLGSLNNQDQLKLLQQNAFSHNHSLRVEGGNNWYQGALMGNYFSNKGNDLNGYNKTTGFNLNNRIRLFNDRLKINWLIKYNYTKSRTGYSLDPKSFEPYQMLLDDKGDYVYDQTALSPAANAIITANGYHNYGINALEDARLNSNKSNLSQFQTNYTMDWDLIDNLKWMTSVYFQNQTTHTENLYNKESSYVRRLVDTYGELGKDGINFYVPYGDIMNKNKRKLQSYNVRSGLGYSKSIGLHTFSTSIGAGASSSYSRQPVTVPIYGYNSKLKTGIPIYLPTPDPNGSISNFNKLLSTNSSVYPYSLIRAINGDSTMSRNLNWNASLSYSFANLFQLRGSYNSVYSPVYGQDQIYSKMNNYEYEISSKVFRNKKRNQAIQSISLSAGVTGMKMPDLPISYSNMRYQQTLWDNYTIWVDGLNPTQQKGQKTTTVFEKATVNLFDSSFLIDLGYNQQKIKGSTASFSNVETSKDTSYTNRFMSAGLTASLRKGKLLLGSDYSKSPEGQSQVNARFSYDIGNESYFKSRIVSSLLLDGMIQNISPYQAMGIMMGTNVSSGGAYSSATNNSFNVLPPKNKTYELHLLIGLNKENTSFDFRYYNRTTSGLNSNVPTYTDPSTGLSSQTIYSIIQNKGLEFYIKQQIIQTKKVNYNIILNGAYNVNVAKSVPTQYFSASNGYATAYRSGYNTSNIWSFNWAGLNDKGDPQVYDKNNNKIAQLDSSTLVNAMVYSGVTNAPWTGGFIQEFKYSQFFARVAMTFQWGFVMRQYMPAMATLGEKSSLIKDRWRVAGDEKNTDVARINKDAGNSFRSFVIQNSSNSIVSADNIRLQEVMLGWNPPITAIKRWGMSSLTLAFHIQNAAIWTKNKKHIDPSRVGSDGSIGMPIPKQYSCTLSVGF